MKIPAALFCLILITGLLVNTNCAKDKEIVSLSPSPPPPPTPPSPPVNSAPIAGAGDDMLVFFPTTFCILYGGAYDPQNNISRTSWNKISGPSSFVIEHPDSLRTRLNNLEIGVYKFELTVTDATGLTGKDTSTVIVGEFPANPQEKIFNNLNWVCPWDCSLEIKNLYSYLLPEHIFKVFIKRDNSSTWLEIFHWSSSLAGDYSFSFYNGDLWVNYSGIDINDTPDIKIVY